MCKSRGHIKNGSIVSECKVNSYVLKDPAGCWGPWCAEESLVYRPLPWPVAQPKPSTSNASHASNRSGVANWLHQMGGGGSQMDSQSGSHVMYHSMYVCGYVCVRLLASVHIYIIIYIYTCLHTAVANAAFFCEITRVVTISITPDLAPNTLEFLESQAAHCDGTSHGRSSSNP